MSDSPDWKPAIAANQLSDDGFHPATAGDHKLIVLRADGAIVAFRDACPHEGYALSVTGERQDFVLVCNKHLWGVRRRHRRAHQSPPQAAMQPQALSRARSRRHGGSGRQRAARSLKRWILPVAVFGSSGTNSIQRGYL